LGKRDVQVRPGFPIRCALPHASGRSVPAYGSVARSRAQPATSRLQRCAARWARPPVKGARARRGAKGVFDQGQAYWAEPVRPLAPRSHDCARAIALPAEADSRCHQGRGQLRSFKQHGLGPCRRCVRPMRVRNRSPALVAMSSGLRRSVSENAAVAVIVPLIPVPVPAIATQESPRIGAAISALKRCFGGMNTCLRPISRTGVGFG